MSPWLYNTWVSVRSVRGGAEPPESLRDLSQKQNQHVFEIEALRTLEVARVHRRLQRSLHGWRTYIELLINSYLIEKWNKETLCILIRSGRCYRIHHDVVRWNTDITYVIIVCGLELKRFFLPCSPRKLCIERETLLVSDFGNFLYNLIYSIIKYSQFPIE